MIETFAKHLSQPAPSGRLFGKDGRMSRTQLLDADQAPITVQPYFADGDPSPIVAALVTVPELLGPTLTFVGTALGLGSVMARAKELAILRTSVLQGCRYCIHAHTAVALDVGLSTGEIRGLRGDIALEDFFPRGVSTP